MTLHGLHHRANHIGDMVSKDYVREGEEEDLEEEDGTQRDSTSKSIAFDKVSWTSSGEYYMLQLIIY
jgi:hypothetical protein